MMITEFMAEYNKVQFTQSPTVRFWRDFGIRTRGANALAAAGIDTVEQLTAMTPSELLELNQFGKLCLSDVLDALAIRGLSLSYIPDDPKFKTREWQHGMAKALIALGWTCTPPALPAGDEWGMD